jgi:hypothetical protein
LGALHLLYCSNWEYLGITVMQFLAVFGSIVVPVGLRCCSTWGVIEDYCDAVLGSIGHYYAAVF